MSKNFEPEKTNKLIFFQKNSKFATNLKYVLQTKCNRR